MKVLRRFHYLLELEENFVSWSYLCFTDLEGQDRALLFGAY